MATPATRSRVNTRTRLLEAAAQLFAEVGLDGASVEAICERAGFTRGAFYSNFATKNELFLELVVSLGTEQLEVVRTRIDELTAAGAFRRGEDFFPTLEQVLDAGGVDRTGVLISGEIRMQGLRDPELGAALIAHEDQLFLQIEEIIDSILASCDLSLRVATDVAARMLMSVWGSAADRATMLGENDEQVHHAAAESLSGIVSLILADS